MAYCNTMHYNSKTIAMVHSWAQSTSIFHRTTTTSNNYCNKLCVIGKLVADSSKHQSVT